MDIFLQPWRRILDFRGRSTRMEYWLFWVFFIAVSAITYFVDDMTLGAGDNMGLTRSIATLVMLWPGTMVAIRRLHDTDRSGWWLLLGVFLGGIGMIVLLVFMVIDTMPDTNRFGPDPKNPNSDLQSVFS